MLKWIVSGRGFAYCHRCRMVAGLPDFKQRRPRQHQTGWKLINGASMIRDTGGDLATEHSRVGVGHDSARCSRPAGRVTGQWPHSYICADRLSRAARLSFGGARSTGQDLGRG